MRDVRRTPQGEWKSTRGRRAEPAPERADRPPRAPRHRERDREPARDGRARAERHAPLRESERDEHRPVRPSGRGERQIGARRDDDRLPPSRRDRVHDDAPAGRLERERGGESSRGRDDEALRESRREPRDERRPSERSERQSPLGGRAAKPEPRRERRPGPRSEPRRESRLARAPKPAPRPAPKAEPPAGDWRVPPPSLPDLATALPHPLAPRAPEPPSPSAFPALREAADPAAATAATAARLAPMMQVLGHQFRDITLLEHAFTHASSKGQAGALQHDNERMEFLGDSVLGLTIAEWLYEKFPWADEGVMSKLKSHLVSTRNMAEIAAACRIGDFMIVGGNSAEARRNERLLCSTLEAVTGAVFLDAGFTAARGMLRRVFHDQMRNLDPRETMEEDAKSTLQEYLQTTHHLLPHYESFNHTDAGEKIYITVIKAKGIVLGEGMGKAKKDSQQDAARRSLERLRAGTVKLK